MTERTAPGFGGYLMTYVVAVAVVATCAATSGSTRLILLAFLLALPTGAPALVGYYVVYGLLAQVPGANPPSGGPAAWFGVMAGVGLVLAPTAAAVVNVLVVRSVVRRGRWSGAVDDDSRPVVPPC